MLPKTTNTDRHKALAIIDTMITIGEYELRENPAIYNDGDMILLQEEIYDKLKKLSDKIFEQI